MKKEELGFFKKLFLVITDFRTYPFLVKNEKFNKSVLYFLAFTLMVSLILTVNIVSKLNISTNNLIENYSKIIPEFELSEGTLKVEKKYNEKLNNDSFLVVNTDYTYGEYTKTKEYSTLVIYDTIMLINKDRIVIETGVDTLKNEILFKDLTISIDKNGLYNELIELQSNYRYLPYLIGAYLTIFISYFIIVSIRVLLVAFLISVICVLTGIRLSFTNYIKMSIYICSLPLLIELITICLVGTIKSYAYYTILLLTYIYMIYAIRSVRLDVFIMMFSKKSQASNIPIEIKNEFKKYNDLVNNEDMSKEEKNVKEDENNND